MGDGAQNGISSRTTGLFLGPVLALALLAIGVPDGLTPEAWRVAALLVLMAVWWATEAIPIPATSLLPLVVIPLIGAGSARETAVGYASPTVLLLLGGFIVAMGVERWNLHSRIALNIVVRAGDHMRLIIAGFMLATALISAWISNTATTIMMVPIAISVAMETGDKSGGFEKALLLGIAYAASIGGVMTPIGTPTNLIAIDWLRLNTGEDIGFLKWMAFGVPAALLLLPVAWFVLTRGLPRYATGNGASPGSARAEIREHLQALGKVSTPEARVAMVFGLIAALWVLRLPMQDYLSVLPGLGWLKHLNDMGIAAFGAVLMFLVPAGGTEKRALLTWDEAEKLPWGVLLLFGGGISLGNAVKSTGLSEWLGGMLAGLEGAPTLVMILVVVALVVYLTEVTSNVATMTTLAPVLGAFAIGVGAPPEAFLGPAAVAASCAFMLPVATAPNAIVYGSRHIQMQDMIRAGFWINLGAVVVITLIGTYLAPLVL
jgi:solute carrier family 13 (sodium-dependent dicarboxylate transporter), member 2/3/5